MKEIEVSINQIKCKFYIPDDETKINEIVVICSGVTTKYYSRTVNEIINRLVQKNYMVVFFDFIQTSRCKRIYKDKLCLYRFEEKLELIYAFLKDKYPNYIINIFSSGFGGYVTLSCINEYNLEFNKIVLNTPAINMREVLKKKLAKENLIDFYKINPKRLDVNKMEQLTDFYNEIIEKDLFKMNNTFKNIFVIHDNRDKVVCFEDNVRFITKCDNSRLIGNINLDNELINKVIENF